MSRARHPSKEIEQAIQYAERHGWTVEKSTGSAHCWGQMLCPANNKQCWNGLHCRQSIWSTPRSAANHAKSLKKIVDKCEFTGDSDE